jgi:hypothetical protein
VHAPGPVDGLLERLADGCLEVGEAAGQLADRHPDGLLPDPVEPLGQVEHGLDAAGTHVVDHRAHPMQHGVHVLLGAWQQRTQLGG